MICKRTNKLLLFLLVTVACSSQKNDVEKVSIHFSMFKHPNITYTVDFKKNQMTSVMLSDGNEGDTVFSEKYVFTKEQSEGFFKEANKDVPENELRIEEPAMDGGGFKITYFKSDGQISNLVVNNIRMGMQKFDMPLKKITAFFEFAYSVTTSIDGQILLDASYRPYYKELPVRKVSDNPLQYRIWGSISGGQETNAALFEFLDNLPKDKCVIINCDSNLSWALQNAILCYYIIVNPDLKFIGNDYLQYTRDNLMEIRRKIVNKESGIDNDPDYHLYMCNKEAMDIWLSLPENKWDITLEMAIQSCK